jgi:hypothetical protein
LGDSNVKNLLALAIALLGTVGFCFAPSANAATATITWPGTINLNLTSGVLPNEDVVTRETRISLDPGNGSTSAIALAANWNALSSMTASASDNALTVKSPGKGASIDVSRSTSFDFVVPTGAAGGSGSVAFNYSFDIDNAVTDPDAYLIALVNMTIIRPDGSFTVIAPSSATAAAGTNGKTSGTISLNFDFLAGDSGVLSVDLLSKGAPIDPAPVPIPATLPLLTSAIVGVSAAARKRRQAKHS